MGLLKQIIVLINNVTSIGRNNSWNKCIHNLSTGRKKFWKIEKMIKGNKNEFSYLTVDGVNGRNLRVKLLKSFKAPGLDSIIILY